MQFGAHLPLIDFDATGFGPGDLATSKGKPTAS
jgi:hypothetical protein